MDRAVTLVSGVDKVSGKDRDIDVIPLGEKQTEVFTADPATFLVANAIYVQLRDSVSELKQLLSEKMEDASIVIDRVIAKMEEVGLIEVVGDRILLQDIEADLADLCTRGKGKNNYFPPLLKALSARIIRQRENKTPGNEQDLIRWMCLPDHPKVRSRLQQLSEKHWGELIEFACEVDRDKDIKGDKLRLFIMLNGVLGLEDV